MKRKYINLSLYCLLILCCWPFVVNASPEVKVGVLKYGTVNWEVDVIKHHKLDKKYNFDLNVVSLGSKNASAVALQSQAVDIILSDWLWVNRQRFNDKNYTIFPTTIVTGGLFVAGDSTIRTIPELEHQKIGIAGGAVDKSWLLLQAYSKKKYRFDIKNNCEATFASPPLLNRLMLRNDLDAAINFWHYGARLKAAGYKLLVSVPQMLLELGINNKPPLLGWVFEQEWAAEHSREIQGFLRASIEAKQLLFSSDTEWQRIRALTKAENDDVFTALKSGYRAGLLREFGAAEINASKQVFKIMAEQGGLDLVGKATHLSEGTFWQTNEVSLDISAKVRPVKHILEKANK